MENMKKIICVIDVQNDFIDGTLSNKDAQEVMPKLVEYLEANKNNATFVSTFDSHHPDYMATQEGQNLPVPHCICGTDGIEQNDMVAEVISEAVYTPYLISKNTFGADPEEWKATIEDIMNEYGMPEEIEFVGFCTDICVVSNALILKALYPEIKMSIVENLCAGVTKDKHNAAIEVLKSCQFEIKRY